MAIEEKARGTSLGSRPREAPLHAGQLGCPSCPSYEYYTTILLGMQILVSLLSVPKMRNGVAFSEVSRGRRTVICWRSFVLCEGFFLGLSALLKTGPSTGLRTSFAEDTPQPRRRIVEKGADNEQQQ